MDIFTHLEKKHQRVDRTTLHHMERGRAAGRGAKLPKGSSSIVRRYKALDVSPHATSLSAYAGTVIQTLQREGPLTAAEIRARVGGSEYSVQSHLDRLVRQDFIVEVSGRAPPKTRRRR